jgi:hypothetical protein
MIDYDFKYVFSISWKLIAFLHSNKIKIILE